MEELRLEMKEAELKRKEADKKELNEMRILTDYNFKILNNMLIERKSKSGIGECDQSSIAHLEVIIGLLQIMDKRLNKLENKNI